MRTFLGLSMFLVVAAGCGKSNKTPDPATKPAASGSAVATAPTVAPGADPAAMKPPAPTYESLMKEGEALEDKKQWADALAKFEAAAQLKPDDARAMSEIGFTAYFAGKLERAKEASTAAVLAAKDDKTRGVALFNLGLSVEKDMPNAAATLYVASITARASQPVRARLTKLQQNPDVHKHTPDGDALLAKVNVKPADLPPTKGTATPADQAMMDTLQSAGVEWGCGAGKCVLQVNDLDCRESHQVKPTTYECVNPAIKGKAAKAIIENLAARKIAPTKEHGDVVTYKVAQVRCRSFDEGDSGAPDECEVTP